MVEPTVSILMGVYNEEKYLSEAIESIRNQTHENFEFIIVDDCSSDGSLEIIRSYNDNRIHLLENETNQGLTYSLNRALEHASGKYIARQDADDISEPNRLERQVRFLKRHEDVAVAGTGAYLIDSNGQVIDRRIPKCDPTFEDFTKKGHLIHGSVMARKSVLESVGGYNEFFRYAQDQELWLRLAKEYIIVNDPAPLYKHRIHDGGVYFSQKDESAMYGMVAHDLNTGRIDKERLNQLERSGILSYYEELSPQRRAEFHRSLATRYLRYGHIQPARDECRQARKYEPYAINSMLLSLLAQLGDEVVHPVRWLLRRYLNTKLRVYNRFNCPFKFE